MKKIIYISLFFLLLFAGARAQQLPMYTQYMFDKMLINPAYTGSSSWIVGTMKYRNQFMGIEGSPVTETFTFHAPIQKKYIGVGLKVIHDEIGITKENHVTGLFSYHLGFAGGKLSFGLEGGIINQSVDFSGLLKKDQNDKAIPLGAEATIAPDASFGIFYQNKNFYAGISSMHLISSKLTYTDYDAGVFAKLFQHYFVFVGNTFKLNDNFVLDPSVLVKYVQAAPMQLDINANLVFKDLVTLGVAYRTGDAVAAVAKFNITESLRVAYSYDFRTSYIATYSAGAHEIMLSYGIKLLPPPAEKEISPRYYF